MLQATFCLPHFLPAVTLPTPLDHYYPRLDVQWAHLGRLIEPVTTHCSCVETLMGQKSESTFVKLVMSSNSTRNLKARCNPSWTLSLDCVFNPRHEFGREEENIDHNPRNEKKRKTYGIKRARIRERQTYHGLEVGRSWWTCGACPLLEELRNPQVPWLLPFPYSSSSSSSSSLLSSLLRTQKSKTQQGKRGRGHAQRSERYTCNNKGKKEWNRSGRQNPKHTNRRETLETGAAPPNPIGTI